MSDFDREAERERLREQFERDEAKREATERMSELLLKGATMTNRHCDACGDPIFRHDGQAFCPTCHGGPGGVGADREETAQGGTEQEGATPEGAPREAAGGEPRQVDSSGEPADATAETGTPAGQTPGRREETPGGAGERPDREDETTVDRGRSGTRGVPGADARIPAPPDVPDAGDRSTGPGEDAGTDRSQDDLAAARASLTRSLAALARRAETTDDVARAREYLAAAREAAEALAAAERVGR